MRVKVITKDHGEFISDELNKDYEELVHLINNASTSESSNLRFSYNGGMILFPIEVLKSSVFIVIKEDSDV